jgi:uncharacterized protein YjbI with pentapeptide repeats
VKARAEIENDFRVTIGQLLGGAALLIGAGFAYVQFTTQRQQFEEQQKAARDLLISNQVAKGFELLGNKDNQLQQRLGGIYALEGVMNTSEQYHKPVLEALSTFVRDGTKTDKGDGPPTTDIQAALTVIGRRTAIETETALPDLKNAHIPRADLRSADLRGAYLYNTDLRHADLRSAYLNRAYVIADLRGAYLDGADLRGATLHGDVGGVDTGADLSGTHLDGADLRGAAVAQAQLDRACGTNVKLDPGLTIKRCP